MYKSSAAAEMGDRLATIDMGRELGRVVPAFFFGGGEEEPGLHLTQCGRGRCLYLCAKFHILSVQPFGHNTPTSQTGQNRQDSGPIA